MGKGLDTTASLGRYRKWTMPVEPARTMTNWELLR